MTKHMLNRRIGALALTAMMAFATRSDAGTRKHPTTKAEPVTLTVWFMPNGPGDNLQNFLDLVKPFAEEHPEIKVQGVVLPWSEALSRIEGALHGGPAPDVTQLGTTWVAAIAATGELVDLTGAYDDKLFPPQVLATTKIKGAPDKAGKQFALPWIVDTRALYYNKDYCRQAGVDPARDFATWETFRQALRKLKQLGRAGKNIAPLGVPMSSWDIIHNLSWWIWGAGGGFAGNGYDPGIASPGTLAGIEYYAGLYREGLLSPAVDRGDELLAAQKLEKGELASAISFPITSLPEEKFGIAFLPAGPRGRFSFLGGSTLAVLKSSQHRKEAIALLNFLSTEAAQVRYSAVTGLLPAAATEYDDLLLKLDPVRGVFVAQMRYGRAYESIPQWGDIETVLKEGLNRVWAKATGAEPYDAHKIQAILEDMQRKIDDVFQRSHTQGAKESQRN